MTLPDDPIQAQPNYAAALAAFQRLPPVRVLFDNGAGSATPGLPAPGFEQSFARFPVPGTQARSWYLGPGGTLRRAKPRERRADAFTWDKRARPATDFTGNTGGAGGLWTATPTYHWLPNPAGHRGVVRDVAADGQHDGRRRGRRAGVDPGVDAATSTCR